MSTNASIAIQRKDGTRTAIYLHWDGYVENAGVILQLAYNTAEKVEELLKLGDLSSLGYYTEPTDEKHDFENPQPHICVAYHRDRGEAYKQTDSQQQFNYLYNEREAVWYVEVDKLVEGTQADKFLNLGGYFASETKLLLDAISEIDFIGKWQDDEFATADMVFSECKEKALEARKEIIERKQAEFDSWYKSYAL